MFYHNLSLEKKDDELSIAQILPHLVKVDLNEKLDPIKTFNNEAKRFRKTKNDNSPMQEIRVANHGPTAGTG